MTRNFSGIKSKMNDRLLLYLLVFTLIQTTIAERKLHRLVGGHLKIINPDSKDFEMLSASASGAREKKQQKLEEDEKKTLSQQVADGKYGLIQKELFTKPPKRPGVISYHDNPEVPKDNINNLGGLSKNEIWLAENHLLVIKGGTYPPHDDKLDNNSPAWPAIDDYKAPTRQVKIPANPKVPPPFPVQLTDDGPLQILGTNSSRTLNGSIEATAYAVPPPEGYEPGTGPYFPPFYPNSPNITAGEAPLPIPINPSGEYPQGAPFPPFLLNGTLPPFFASLPPGAAILPPPGNLTDQYDEDDPSIYYPPPYSFYFPKDNSSAVPAGPLVPGIILPPPPNFFGPLDVTTTLKPFRRIPGTTQQSPQIHPTTTPIPATVVTRKKPEKLQPVYVPEINNELKPVITSTRAPHVVTILPVRYNNRSASRPKTQRTKKPPSVTILRPVKPTTTPPKVYVYNNEVSNNGFPVYGPPSNGEKTIISTTQVPLKAYYSTSNELNKNIVTQGPEKFHIGITPTKPTKLPPRQPAKYFYYEEDPQSNSVTTPNHSVKQSAYQSTSRPRPQNQYYDIQNEYYESAKPSRPVIQSKPQYIYVTARPYNTQRPKYRFVQQTPKTDSFSIHIARLQKQIHQYYTTTKPYNSAPSSKPVYQYSFEAANYKPQQNSFKPSPELSDPQDKFRPLPKYSVQIQQAVEIIPTESPRGFQNAPSPIYYQQQQAFSDTTDRPSPPKYYSTVRPEYDYQEQVPQKDQYIQQVATPRPISQYSFEATPNPVYKGYYTKQEDVYYDDNTKKYFTMFGQKIPSGTTPIPRTQSSTAQPSPVYTQSQRQEQYQPQKQQQKPVSLAGDTLVNYVNPRPTINPDSEVVQISPVNSAQGHYAQVAKYLQRPPQYVQQSQTRQRNTGPEIVKAVPVNVPTAEGQPGSFISYQLPGDDGAHFYFLTPQLAQRRDQGVGYFYSQPNGSRIRRNEKNSDKER